MPDPPIFGQRRDGRRHPLLSENRGRPTHRRHGRRMPEVSYSGFRFIYRRGWNEPIWIYLFRSAK